MNKHLTAILLIIWISLGTFAQQTAIYTNDLNEFQKAMELYNNDQFLAAQPLFQKLERTANQQGLKGDAAYYAANCAVRLNQQGADAMMEAFFKEYPTSLKRNSAYLEVAEFYFENAKYSRAQKWYDKVDDAGLSKGQMGKFNFNNGYANFKAKRYNEAQKYFNRVVNSKNYGAQAKYYLGFIAYQNDDYDEATEYFEEVKDQERYGQDLSYYQADMNFKLGKFEKAVELGLAQYESADRRDQSELSKIIGESYFNLEKYAEAIPYLKEYKGKRGRWNNTDYYLLGYAYYKQKAYDLAISEFNKIIDGSDAVAQNAFYHLAESYLELDKKQEALNAFKNASEMDFSDEIREDAWLNYAKLSYEIGNPYQSVPQVLARYLETYPDSPNKDQLNDLLIDSYITSKNYKEALALLEKNKSFENKLAYQKVAFYRAVELYNESDYAGAKKFFDLSLKEPRDAGYTARATYWKAQADYEQSNFGEALIGYRQFLQLPGSASLEESTHIDYHKAYTHFKLKEYVQAIDGFSSFVKKTSDLARKNDAYLRLGDSYFVTSKYWPAMENYNAAIQGGIPDTDYAEFQKAISYGFVGRPNQKIEGLQNFADKYPKSAFKDDAIYELGNTYVAVDNIPDALRAYNRLISDNQRSSYVPKAMLKKALLLENDGNSTQALDIFKEVAARYPSTDEALQAVASAKLIYIDQGRVDAYGDWVSGLDFVEVADSELDDASYQAAEQQYLANKSKEAIERFDKYLNEFPRGRHALQANFYLAQLYFGASEFNKTIPHYRFVCDLDRNEFTEQALARLSQVYLENKDYQNAISLLERLEKTADFPQNIVFAQSNIMKSSYELERYEQAVTYAEKVLDNPKIDNKVQSDAQLIIARSAIKTNQEDKARLAYAQVAKIATGALKAEALYYDAYFKNKEGDYPGSNAAVQILAKDYSGYKLYGAKGLIIMAKNFYALDDVYQATYILESVISNFSDFPEVVSQAQTELITIKAAAAKTNSSVETDGN